MSRSIRKQLPPFAFTAVLAMVLANDAAAQRSAETGSRNSRPSVRQGFQSNAGGGSQRLPFSSQGGSRGQQGGFGQSRNGGMGMNAGAGAGMSEGGVGQGPMAAGLAQTAGERFQEGGFVGRDADDVRNSFDSLSGGRGPGQMMDMMIENLNEMRDARRRWRDQNSAPPPVRVRLEPAFDLPVTPRAGANPAVQARLAGIMQARGVSSASVELAAGVAVIRGVAANEHERALLAQIAVLEPGVSRVENLVTILPPPAPPRQ